MIPKIDPLRLLPVAAALALASGCDPAPGDGPSLPPGAPPADHVFVTGAPLVGGAGGMFFDADDRLYASGAAQRITVLDPDTGTILDHIGTEVGVFLPDDLTIAPDGTLYWTEILLGRVHGLTPSGELLTLAENLFGTNPITVSDAGEVFFAQCFNPEGNGLFQADPAGMSPPLPILEDQEGCAANGMDWWDGALYLPRWFEDRIVRLDLATHEITDVTTGFSVPTALKFDSIGRLHAISTATGEVVRVDLDTGERTLLAQLPPGLDNLAFDSHDRLFVSVPTDASILEILPEGGTRTVTAPGLNVPSGLAVMDDIIYASGIGSIRGYDIDSAEQVSVVRSSLATPGSVPFNPGSLTRVGDHLVLTETLGARIARWRPADETTLGVSAPFGQIADVEPFMGGVVVSDLGTGTVVLATGPDFAERTTLASGLLAPSGLAAHGQDLYVADVALGSVLQIVEDGSPLASPQPLALDPLDRPEGITVRPTGELVVVEVGTGMVKEVDIQTGAVGIVATDLEFLPSIEGISPVHFFNDVTADDDGRLYVNGDGAGVIYRL